MGAAVGFYTGGPIGAIIGGSIGLIGSTLDMAFNDRCHYAMNCKKGWEQNCKTGECIAQEFTEETIGDYGDTDPKQIIDLQGPVKGLKTNPGTTNCRGCGGESYKNNVDNLDVHPFISESSQEPPFSLEGIEEEYGIVSFIQE